MAKAKTNKATRESGFFDVIWFRRSPGRSLPDLPGLLYIRDEDQSVRDMSALCFQKLCGAVPSLRVFC